MRVRECGAFVIVLKLNNVRLRVLASAQRRQDLALSDAIQSRMLNGVGAKRQPQRDEAKPRKLVRKGVPTCI
jgi:hypothetical protein